MTATEEYPIVSDNPRIQAHYEECRRQGTSHTLSEMFAFEKAPRANDDTTWLASQGQNEFLAAYPEPVREHYQKVWKEAGVSAGGAVMCNQLAEFPGDPRALVRGKGDMIKIAEERGLGLVDPVDGRQIVKADNSRPPKPDIEIADDIVLDEVQARMAENPDLKYSDELFHEVREDIKPPY